MKKKINLDSCQITARKFDNSPQKLEIYRSIPNRSRDCSTERVQMKSSDMMKYAPKPHKKKSMFGIKVIKKNTIHKKYKDGHKIKHFNKLAVNSKLRKVRKRRK